MVAGKSRNLKETCVRIVRTPGVVTSSLDDARIVLGLISHTSNRVFVFPVRAFVGLRSINRTSTNGTGRIFKKNGTGTAPARDGIDPIKMQKAKTIMESVNVAEWCLLSDVSPQGLQTPKGWPTRSSWRGSIPTRGTTLPLYE